MPHLRPSADPATAVQQLRAWLEADDPERLLIETSGSTGTPKKVLLSRDAVVASADASAARLGATGAWALALPSWYVAGVQVIVRSLLAGHDPLIVDNLDFHSRWSKESLASSGPTETFTSLVPTQLHRILADERQVSVLRSMHTVLVGGGPMGDLKQRAAQAGIRVVTTYGSSETAGGCVYDGLPLDGVGVALGVEGRIRISGPTIFEGYADDQALTEEVLHNGWFLTSDLGQFDADGLLRVSGRVDDVVISGGVNIPLSAVAHRIRENPQVVAAEVIGVDDDEWGQRLVAFVVGPVTTALIRDWVSEAQPRAWAPQSVVVVDSLPLLSNGKVDRQELVAQAALHPRTTA